MNANSVPMEARSVTNWELKKRVGKATITPVITDEKAGVLNLGWIEAKGLGRSPSRAILMKILGWPS